MTFLLTSIASLILLFLLLRNEAILQKYPILISLMIYLIITVNSIVPSIRLEKFNLSMIEYGSLMTFNIIAIYTILPLNKIFIVLLASAMSLLNFACMCFYLYKLNLPTALTAKKVWFFIFYFSNYLKNFRIDANNKI